jgi:hypothetical protein
VKVPVEELGVLVGAYSLFTISNNEKFIPVSQKVQHPDYYFPTPLNNDIGKAGQTVLELSSCKKKCNIYSCSKFGERLLYIRAAKICKNSCENFPLVLGLFGSIYVMGALLLSSHWANQEKNLQFERIERVHLCIATTFHPASNCPC